MKVDFIIDRAATPAASGATYARRDPVTRAVASEAAAARAFPAWSETRPSARRALLLKAADLLDARAGEFTKPTIEEIGATAPWAGVDFPAPLSPTSAVISPFGR